MQLERKNHILYILCFVVAAAISVFVFPEGITGVMLAVAGCFLVRHLIRKSEDREFLWQLFLSALLCRVCFAGVIFYFKAYHYFGADAETYDFIAANILKMLAGAPASDNYAVMTAYQMRGPGWGMSWLVAFIYSLTGQNIFATMMIECVLGAATVLLLYEIVIEIFNNSRVARLTAFLAAVFPAMVIWSSQALKDGFIVFLLVLVMLCVIRLQKKYSILYTALLIFSLSGILALRFYIFYIAAIAVTGSFLIGTSNNLRETARRLMIFAVVAMGLIYVGAIRNASSDFERYANLETVQQSRDDLASRADSGYGRDLDVSTTEGALVALPVGFAYLMLAPFPWEVTNLRQSLVMPENLVWWGLLPFLVMGFWYTIKTRWRKSVAILIFTLLLTVAYSVFQGNVGTAYRQRTQIQVFHFIFIAVGLVMMRERQENKQIGRRF